MAYRWMMVALLLIAGPLAAQPGWYREPHKDFPPSRFLHGSGIGSGADRAERMQLAEENARSNLIKVIRTRISSEFLAQTTETEQRLEAFTQSRVTSSAQLEVDGIRVERRADQGGTAYALAVLDRAEGQRLHRAKRERLARELAARLAEAERYEAAGELELALQRYLSCYPLLAARDEAETVLLALGDFSAAAWDELAQATGEAWPRVSAATVSAAVERLTGGDFASLDAVVAALAFRLGGQLPPGRAVIVLPPSYGETRFTSGFSRYLAQALAPRLAAGGWRLVERPAAFQPRSADHRGELARQAGAELVVSGSYVELGSSLKLFLLATEAASGHKVGGVELTVETRLVTQAGLDIRPRNFQQALQDAGVFGQGELVGGHLQVEVWTDRGSEELYLEADERVTLAVRVNQPCYVRLIYHLANGRRALLYDNYYIDQAKVNHAVVLPDTFYVAPPFGVEVLQALASSEPFPALATRDWEGYLVLAEDLPQFVAQTRGLKKQQKTRELAEMRVTLTTLPRE